MSVTQDGRNGSVLGPHCLTYSKDRNWIYVTDYLGKKILKFTADLKFHSVFLDHETLKPDWLLTGPATLRIDPHNHYYVCDYGSNSIQIFSEQGDFLEFIGKSSEGRPIAGNLPNEFDRVHDILFLSDGGFIVVDTWNSRLQKFSKDRSEINQIQQGWKLFF
jgi:sugar lactone lactonase YvrE